MLRPTDATAEPKPVMVDASGSEIDVIGAPLVPSNKKTPPMAPARLTFGAPTITLLPIPRHRRTEIRASLRIGFAMESSRSPKLAWVVSPSNS